MNTVYARPAFSNGGGIRPNQSRPALNFSKLRTYASSSEATLAFAKSWDEQIFGPKLWVEPGFRSVDSVCAYQVCFLLVHLRCMVQIRGMEDQG